MAIKYITTQEQANEMRQIGECLIAEGGYLQRTNPLAVASDLGQIMTSGATLFEWLVGFGLWLCKDMKVGKVNDSHYEAVSAMSLMFLTEAEHVKHTYPDFMTANKEMKLHEFLLSVSRKVRLIADEISGNGE